MDRVSHGLGTTPHNPAAWAQSQAPFVNPDGQVEVQRAHSVTWENDHRSTLDRGDLIRTGDDGITFVDGPTYTLKVNSFVTVEQNSHEIMLTGQNRRGTAIERVPMVFHDNCVACKGNASGKGVGKDDQ